jgi:hypothetical protein
MQDAITATKQLGYRHLWVDEYCIEQGNKTQRAAQIESVDQIYQSVDLTVVAAAGQDKAYGLPGVGLTLRKNGPVMYRDGMIIFSNGPRPDQDIYQSKWFSRAW